MKSGKEENNKSIDLIKKLKYNMNRTNNQPMRYNSAFKQRPFSTFKARIHNFDKQSFLTKNNYFIPKLGKIYLASKCNDLNKKKNSFIWRRNKQCSLDNNNNKYFAKEELVEKVVKLKKALNKLNDKNAEQKIKLNKQKKELKKQNEMLNEVNKKYYFEQFFKNYEWDNDRDKEISYDTFDCGLGYVFSDKKTKTPKSLPKNKSAEGIKNIPNIKNTYFEMQDNLANISYNGLRDLYSKMVMQNDRKDKEITILKEQLEHNRISYESLLSNMKIQYKQLLNDNDKKKEEIIKLKRNSKVTKFNEIMREKEIFEQVMLNMKFKFNKAMEAQENYKLSLKKMKFLLDEINSKDIKIGYMENKLKLNTKNYETNIENLKIELNKKNKRLKKLENDFKKLNIKVSSSMGDLKISSLKYKEKEKEKEKKEFVIESQNNNFMIISCLKNYEKIEIKDNDTDKYSDFFDDKITNKNNNINQNMNFSNEIKEQNNNELNKNDNENNLNNIESLANINKIDEIPKDNKSNDNNEQNKENKEKENIKIERLNENENQFSELLLIYIELNKRKMDVKSFINEIFSKLNNENSIIDNKKIFHDYLIQYFNISDELGKNIIEKFANKEFKENKSLEEIKNYLIEQVNELSSKEKNEDEEEYLKKLGEIEENNFNKIIEKYDDVQSGLVYYNQMVSIIKELNMEEFIFKILLLTKDIDVFNLFNYQNLLNIITERNKNEKIELKESEILKENKIEEKEQEEKKDEKEEEKKEEKEEKEEKEKEEEKKDEKERKKDESKEKKVETKEEVKKEEKKEEKEILIEENKKNQTEKEKYEEELKINNTDKNNQSNEDKDNQSNEDKENKQNEDKNNKLNEDENNKQNEEDNKRLNIDKNNISKEHKEENEEDEEKYDDFNQIDLSEKVLKSLSHYIIIEGSTPKLYINFLKEEFNSINVINPEKLFKFLEEKNIQVNEEEKEEIINKYGIENNEVYTVQYIDFDKFAEKLFELIKNDDAASNGEDFMKNIKSMEIEGID